MRTLTLKPGHAKPLWHGHPWVFADSIAEADSPSPDTAEDDWVLVRDADGKLVGHGLCSERSAIRVRLLGPGEEAGPLETLLASRIEKAAALRARLFPDPSVTNAYRLVHAEADGLPGLVVDRFDDVLVAQLATQPMFARREALARRLLEVTGARSLVARPAGFEREEGIDSAQPFGAGEAFDGIVPIVEGGTPLLADPLHGQKTGHYVDQRENRIRVAEIAKGLDLLDLFAGSGGFSVQALAHGARSALAVDSGQRAVAAASANAAHAGVADQFTAERADVTDMLSALKTSQRKFGVVVVDPPNLVPKHGARKRAMKVWRELIVRSLTRVTDGGFCAVFSCTPRVDADDLLQLMHSASRDCRRPFRVLRALSAGPDHPVLPGAPMTRYLSGHLVEVRPW